MVLQEDEGSREDEGSSTTSERAAGAKIHY